MAEELNRADEGYKNTNTHIHTHMQTPACLHPVKKKKKTATIFLRVYLSLDSAFFLAPLFSRYVLEHAAMTH